jgi:hypothetical protein
MFRLYPEVSAAVSRTLFVTGSIRTGTTMMGQLAHSLKDVEHIHEPPQLYVMFPLIDEMPAEQWKFLFETYMFHDFGLHAIAGRRINLNKFDDSSIHKVKSEADIAERMGKSHRAGDIFPKTLTQRLSFKTPEVLPYLRKFRSYYPDMPIICMFRKPESVIASILYYEWYADKNLVGFNGEWLFQERAKVKIPYWVPPDIVDRWAEMPEVERAGYVYVHQYGRLDEVENLILVDYDDFITAAKSRFAKLAQILGVEYGPMTESLLDKVKETERERNPPISDIDPALRKGIADAYDRCKELAVRL